MLNNYSERKSVNLFFMNKSENRGVTILFIENTHENEIKLIPILEFF